MTDPLESFLKRVKDVSTRERVQRAALEPLWRLLVPSNEDLTMDRPAEPREMPERLITRWK
ncbi:hypothetical protein J5X84_07270 [Streptosporangiaceae bacterium NEAU-GS5]|nr:hypothetical protein [Streptosporangiaceae bacterium NEAU-GS5]